MVLEGGERDEGDRGQMTIVFDAGVVGESIEVGILGR